MNKFWIPATGVACAGLVALALTHHFASSSSSARDILTKSASPAGSATIASARTSVKTAASQTSQLTGGFAVDAANVGATESRRALEGWAQQDSDAALAWAARITDAAQRQQAREIICLTLAQSDPRRAVQASIDTGLCDTSAGLLENLTAQWASTDFSAAHDWVRQQESGGWRDDLVARIAFAGSQSDPADAARLVVAEMAPGPKQNEAAICVLHQWALRDLDAAATWAETFPEGELRTRALGEIAGIRLSRQTSLAQP
jgi:hypothetical protein